MLSLAKLLSFVNFPSTVVIMDVTDREFERSNLFLRTMSQVQGSAAIGRPVWLALLLAAFAIAADPPIPPLTVCEVLADLPAHEGKDLAVLGRFSFRRDGRWIGEQSCEPATTVPPRFRVMRAPLRWPQPPRRSRIRCRRAQQKVRRADAPHLARQVPFRRLGVRSLGGGLGQGG